MPAKWGSQVVLHHGPPTIHMAPELLKVLLACGGDAHVDVAHHQLQSIPGLGRASHLELINELACRIGQGSSTAAGGQYKASGQSHNACNVVAPRQATHTKPMLMLNRLKQQAMVHIDMMMYTIHLRIGSDLSIDTIISTSTRTPTRHGGQCLLRPWQEPVDGAPIDEPRELLGTATKLGTHG